MPIKVSLKVNKVNEFNRYIAKGVLEKRNLYLQNKLNKIKGILQEKKHLVEANVEKLKQLSKKDKNYQKDYKIYKKVLSRYDDYVNSIGIVNGKITLSKKIAKGIPLNWVGSILEYGTRRVPPIIHWRALNK